MMADTRMKSLGKILLAALAVTLSSPMATLTTTAFSPRTAAPAFVGSSRTSSNTNVLHSHTYHPLPVLHSSRLSSLSSAVDDNSESADQEGADLAAEFFKMAQQKGIGLGADDALDDDEEDGEEEDELEEPSTFGGDDTGKVGEQLAGNDSLTDDQLYSEVKERVLDTAGGFVDFVKRAKDDDDDDDGEDTDDRDYFDEDVPKEYHPPLTVPDSELTAGEVVLLLLDVLLHKDVPTKNKGVEILFGYSSPGSSIKNEEGLTPAEYADFLNESEYKVLFDHTSVTIDKGTYSFDGKKGFFTARLQTGPGPLDTVSVNFILSTTGKDDDACWLVDSMLIRPESMRRRRRR